MLASINRAVQATEGLAKALHVPKANHNTNLEVIEKVNQKLTKLARGFTTSFATLAVVSAFSLHSLQAQVGPGKIGKNSVTKKVSGSKKTTIAPPVAPAVLNYQFTPGATYHFKVAALFDGHFPPFAVGPDSQAVHFKADLGYTATVKKVDAEGATVDFVVDSRALYLFNHEMAENEKMDLTRNDIQSLDGLTSLEDIQKALNASAILRPDGTIVRILSTSTVKVPFDVGFDIRKLFLMLLPVTFPGKAVKPGDTWPAVDGLLGSKPGKTNYMDRLDSVATSGADKTYRLHQSANSTVADKLDKAGNSTAKDEEAYRILSGKVDLTTETTFVSTTTPMQGKPDPANPANAPAQKPAPDNPANGNATKAAIKNGKADAKVQVGQVKSAHLLMNAVINRKRVKINPDQPEIPENDPLDVKARMTVTRDEPAAKPPPVNNPSDEKPKKG